MKIVKRTMTAPSTLAVIVTYCAWLADDGRPASWTSHAAFAERLTDEAVKRFEAWYAKGESSFQMELVEEPTAELPDRVAS